MKYILLLPVLLLAPLAVLAQQAEAPNPVATPATPLGRPIVVELYTSQGCSSCPPADAFLGQLVSQPGVLPLSFHVDYWDYIGWKDPFGDPQFTNRQRVYNTNFEVGSLFTPQMVIDGLATAVGSQKNAVQKVIRQAQSNTTDIPISFKVDREKNEIRIGVKGLDDGINVEGMDDYLDVWLVTFNKGFATPIEAGENVGKDLPSYNIVRKLTLLGKWNKRSNFYRVDLESFREDAMAVIIQEQEQGRIVGANSYYQR